MHQFKLSLMHLKVNGRYQYSLPPNTPAFISLTTIQYLVKFFPFEFVLVFYCCTKNSHRFRSLKEYLFIRSQLCRSEAQHGIPGFSAQGTKTLKSMDKTDQVLI